MVASSLIRVCDATALADNGPGVRFEVSMGGIATPAFVLRWRGQVVGYLNRCSHVPAELDWNLGQFLDSNLEFILCATHGAIYDPLGGQCLGGPCRGRGGLRRLDVIEKDNAVWWQPDDVLTEWVKPQERERPPPATSSPSE